MLEGEGEVGPEDEERRDAPQLPLENDGANTFGITEMEGEVG